MLDPAYYAAAHAFQPHEGEIGYGIRPKLGDQQAERQPASVLAALALADPDVAWGHVRQLAQLENPV